MEEEVYESEGRRAKVGESDSKERERGEWRLGDRGFTQGSDQV